MMNEKQSFLIHHSSFRIHHCFSRCARMMYTAPLLKQHPNPFTRHPKEVGHQMKTGRIFAFALALVALALAASACNKVGKSPTATAKAIYDAQKNKDAATMKKAMSKRTLDALEQFAKSQNKSLDDWMKENMTKPPTIPFEVKDEKINGDMGTLEVKTEGGRWQTFHFVKEDGLWKWDAQMTMQGGNAPDMDEGGTTGGGEHGGHQ